MQLLTQSALLRVLGWSLLNSLWQMALLWLIYIVLVRVFRQASARAKHGLALSMLSVGTSWTVITFLTAFFSPEDGLTQTVDLSSLAGLQFTGSMAETCKTLIIAALPWASTIYLAVLSLLFIRYMRQYFAARTLVHTDLTKPAPGLRVFTQQISRRLGIRKEVSCWLSSRISTPITLGVLKPVILLPLSMATRLTTEQTEALILHELAHIRQRDYLLHLWIAALEVLFFFNPFAKLLIHYIQKEREHRCDDFVMQFRDDARSYVSALLTLAKQTPSPQLVLAATGANEKVLLHRVRRLMKLETKPEPVKAKWLIPALFTLTLVAIALSRPGIVENIGVADLPSPDPVSVETRTKVLFAALKINPATSDQTASDKSVGSNVPEMSATMPSIDPQTGVASGTAASTTTPAASTRASTRLIESATLVASTAPMTSPAPSISTTPGPATTAHTHSMTWNIYSSGHKSAASTVSPDGIEYQLIDDASAAVPVFTTATDQDSLVVGYAAAATTSIINGKGDKRDYSIAPPHNTADYNAVYEGFPQHVAGTPYVPQASFSYQVVQDSSGLPGEQYVYLQQMATAQVKLAIAKMTHELELQLKILVRETNPEKAAELKAKRQILLEQLKLQQDYLQKQDELQRKLQKIGRKKVIVVI